VVTLPFAILCGRRVLVVLVRGIPMRARPVIPEATPETRAPRAQLPVNGIRVTVRPLVTSVHIHGWARTLGEGGLYLETDQPLPNDTEVRIELLTRVDRSPHRLRLLGWVVYWDGHGMGIQFDPESLKAWPQFEAILAYYLAESRNMSPV